MNWSNILTSYVWVNTKVQNKRDNIITQDGQILYYIISSSAGHAKVHTAHPLSSADTLYSPNIYGRRESIFLLQRKCTLELWCYKSGILYSIHITAKTEGN